MVARVVLTAMAAALAVAVVGAMILRQQRKAVELEGRLRLAQALASARQTSESIVENAPLGVLGVSHGRQGRAGQQLPHRSLRADPHRRAAARRRSPARAPSGRRRCSRCWKTTAAR